MKKIAIIIVFLLFPIHFPICLNANAQLENKTMPDIVINKIKISNERAEDGDDIAIFAYIENLGKYTSEEFFVRYFVDGNVLGTSQIKLTPNNLSTSSINWHTASGAHDIRVEADYTNLIAEENEGNNFLLKEIIVPYPDLSIESIDIPNELIEGEEITITTIVKNYGSTTKNVLTVATYIDDKPLETNFISGLRKNGTFIITSKLKLSSGKHIIKALVDANENIIESNEINNLFMKAFSVGYPDLAFENISLSGYMEDGKNLSIFASIKNFGETTAREVYVNFYINGIKKGTKALFGIKRNEVLNIIFDFLAEPGYREFLLFVDEENLIKEANETNNYALLNISIPYPDILLESIETGTSSPKDGEEIKIKTKLKNIGEGNTSKPFNLYIYVDGERTTVFPVENLSAGIEKEYEGTWVAKSGKHELMAQADGDMVISEADETNNKKIIDIDIGYPDILIGEVNFYPFELKDGDDITIYATVLNNGKETKREFTCYFFANNLLVGTAVVDGLRTGEIKTISSIFTVFGGKNEILVIADSTNVVIESNESNFFIEEIFVPLPDILVEELSW
ncbi:MAG: CARDB domain-containing protein, partial [Candidatus Thermoplasmatota archaeon]